MRISAVIKINLRNCIRNGCDGVSARARIDRERTRNIYIGKSDFHWLQTLHAIRQKSKENLKHLEYLLSRCVDHSQLIAILLLSHRTRFLLFFPRRLKLMVIMAMAKSGKDQNHKLCFWFPFDKFVIRAAGSKRKEKKYDETSFMRMAVGHTKAD